jgi:RNA polymerase sigma factor (TIGR02999 family)
MEQYTQWLNLRDSKRDDIVFGLYSESKKIAAGRMAAERPGQTLNATALVHEAWFRIEKLSPEQWRDRKQFFAAASEAMRRIQVEAARRRIAVKRGNGGEKVPLDKLEISSPVPDERIMEIHEVLDQLEAEDALKAHIVKLRFFRGMDHFAVPYHFSDLRKDIVFMPYARVLSERPVQTGSEHGGVPGVNIRDKDSGFSAIVLVTFFAYDETKGRQFTAPVSTVPAGTGMER